MPRPHLPRRALLIVLAVLLLVALPLGWYVYDSSRIVQMQRLEAARVRWEARPFAGYKLDYAYVKTYTESGNAHKCFVKVAVEGQQITRIYRDSCGLPRADDWTVDRMFLDTRDILLGHSAEHLANGCTLDTMQLIINYDPQLGYPSYFVNNRGLTRDWHRLTFWQDVWQRGQIPDCTDASLKESTIEISITVAPLP